jgi:hypothetical protein
LRDEPLFWPTLFELTATEAITAFYVCGHAGHEPPLMELLRSSMDYVLHVGGGPAAATDGPRAVSAERSDIVPGRGLPAKLQVTLEKHPDLAPGQAMSSVDYTISNKGLIYPPRSRRRQVPSQPNAGASQAG